VKRNFPENEQAKFLLEGASCWTCQYSIKGSFNPKDWMCVNHQKSDLLEEEKYLPVPEELICDFYLRSGADAKGVIAHIWRMQKKYDQGQISKNTP
jgi:hypothetical protein